MFEFHGWANLQYHTQYEVVSHNEEKTIQRLRKFIKDTDAEDVCFIRNYNTLDSLVIDGMHNHRREYVIEIFKWIADNIPGAYGILYINDDEDSYRENNYENEFRVWKLARGKLEELDDKYLSPRIPEVEDGFIPDWENYISFFNEHKINYIRKGNNLLIPYSEFQSAIKKIFNIGIKIIGFDTFIVNKDNFSVSSILYTKDYRDHQPDLETVLDDIKYVSKETTHFELVLEF